MSKKSINRMAIRIITTVLVLTLITSPLLSQTLRLSIPDTSAAANSLVKIPIRVTNVSGLNILSLAITLTFDQNVLDALGANSLGTISESWGNPLTSDSTGQIKLTMMGLTPLPGEGVLTFLFFDVTGTKGDTTTIHFKNIRINEGGIATSTIPGKFLTLAGEPAPHIRLTIPDSSTTVGSIIDLPILVSDPASYDIDSIKITITFNKYVIRALNVITEATLTNNWTASIEALLPGKLSLFLTGTPALSDSGILFKLQFQLNGRPGMSTAVHVQGVHFYNDTLKVTATDGKITISSGASTEVIVSMPDISADSSEIVDVPIFISDATDYSVIAIAIHLKFNKTVLQYQGYNTVNTLMAGWLCADKQFPDSVKVNGSSGIPLIGAGVLMEFKFKVIGRPGMQTAITFAQMMLNEGAPSVTAYDGLFTVNYVIPVELVSLHARVNGKDVHLTWETASESDNYGFDIERAKKLNEWCLIGFVPGHGTTTIPHQYSFIDKNIDVGAYDYRLKQVDVDGSFEYSAVIQIVVHPPKQFSLGQNYPNPFNPTTVIPFDLPEKSNITLMLYNLLGEKVEVISTGEYRAGHHQVSFHASNLSAGLYFYKLEAKDFVDIKKLLILR